MSELTQEIEKEEGMYVYDKKIECPVCMKEFTTKIVKTGKARFKGSEMDLRPIYDEAVVRYKMALLTAIKKPAKLSECAYLCLKLSWLYRSMSEEKIEEHYREKAYKGFEEALQKEYPPICGMDENTISYLMSVLAYKSGDNDKAMQYGYSVISSRGASTKLKDKEREIIDILKAEK